MKSPLIRRREVLLLTGAAATLGCAPALAQSNHYPNRPITLVVGYPPGGSTDLTARVLAEQLARSLGQPVVVENVGGAGGARGAQRVAQATADGHTLLLGSNNEMAIAGLINPALRYDPVKQFTPVGMVASQPMVLVASPSAGMPNIAGFIERVKQNPGKFSYGSAGVGTALNLAGEMVKQAAGLFIVHIPYRGVGPLTTDLIGGQVELGVYVLSSGLPQIKAGKVVPLGVTERERSPVAPDIPALAETPSLRHVDIGTWFGLWGPAGLPAPVAQRLRGALTESLKVPSLVEKLTASGATIAPASAVLADFQAAEIAKYRRIVDHAGIRV
ncbi:tripartite tricarboxylate transporter substrate-binding protein [Hydrogenophaga sp.]|uniref:Bug family tripartite tricarboxylate transporter substrate binding protein n=1 Tax=Hydrogenophaga sp. TaxID=1904254 RepID=UPI001AD38F9E|nr:tripartite tricarboxylate transporter substrate-binding protein [Hydrogenophaga sp.]MBN9370553.1 tripartite tricarboxylate transporter substrate binding protein [Hydrogenophaga sp.]